MLALVLAAPSLAAGDTRTFKTDGPLGRSRQVELDAELGSGRFDLYPDAPRGKLYAVEVEHDADLEPEVRFQGGTLRLRSEGGRLGGGRKRNEWDVHLSREPTWDLDLSIGAAKAYLELGGLKVRELDLEAGAAQVTVEWEKANPVELERARVRGGAAQIKLLGLGRARLQELDLEGGAGNFELDFAGGLRGRTRVRIQTGAGNVTVRIPAAVGIRIARKTVALAQVSLPDDVGGGKRPQSANYDAAAGKLDLEITAAVGRVVVERL